MPYTERDIVGWFGAVNELVDRIAGADLPEAEREQVKMLASAGLKLAESLAIDHNRIANALQELLYIEQQRFSQRG
jgi:hypothetical protein